MNLPTEHFHLPLEAQTNVPCSGCAEHIKRGEQAIWIRIPQKGSRLMHPQCYDKAMETLKKEAQP